MNDAGSITVNADGTRVAFIARGDLVNKNADGNFEVFLHDVPSSRTTQVTQTTGGDADAAAGNLAVRINADGSRLALVSNHDFTGDNPDGGYELFTYDVDFDLFVQRTFTPGNDKLGPFTVPAISLPSIDGVGDRIVFRSRYDLAGANADGNDEFFLWDATGAVPRILQITDPHRHGRPVPHRHTHAHADRHATGDPGEQQVRRPQRRPYT